MKNRLSEKQQLNSLNYIHLILFWGRRKLAERTYIKTMIKREISLRSAFTVLESAIHASGIKDLKDLTQQRTLHATMLTCQEN